MNTYARMIGVGSSHRGVGAATTTSTTTTPAPTNWVLWGSVAVLAATGVYLYRKRRH
jgi:LPXTG-motif cell wall-anchored protein